MYYDYYVDMIFYVQISWLFDKLFIRVLTESDCDCDTSNWIEIDIFSAFENVN